MYSRVFMKTLNENGELYIQKPLLRAKEVSAEAWCDKTTQDGSLVRIYRYQTGFRGSTIFHLQIKSFGRLSTSAKSKAQPKHIVSTAYFTIKEIEEILEYMKKKESS